MSSPAQDPIEDEIAEVYGDRGTLASEPVLMGGRQREDFAPWHHPVKQIVRQRQWTKQTEMLIRDARINGILRYFTLPGPDFLDVSSLAEVCHPRGIQIEYFGFNSGARQSHSTAESDADESSGRFTSVESALRQSNRVTANAVVLPDRLEDIAIAGSHAANQLTRRPPFDVVNIDVCDHLAYSPAGRTRNAFDALCALLNHQMRHTSPWLLFLTTRADPALLGRPGIEFQHAVTRNVSESPDEFVPALVDALELDETRVASELAACWGRDDLPFLKLYTIGIGKYLLQYFMQPQLRANVQLKSAFAYQVGKDRLDMLALAFRITPRQLSVFPPTRGIQVPVQSLEPAEAVGIAQKAKAMWNLEDALKDATVLSEAVQGTESLLHSRNFDVGSWRNWLANHPVRPIALFAPANELLRGG